MTHPIVENRIAGTRVSVWDVLHYLQNNWSPREIADFFGLSDAQVQAAVEYIDQNRETVMEVQRRIEERNARGNPPEVDARLAESRAKLEAWKNGRTCTEQQEHHGARNPGGR